MLTTFIRGNFQVFAANISPEELVSKLKTAEESWQDYSSTFVTTATDSGSIAKFNALLEGMAGQPLPKEQQMKIWMKKPHSMKTETPDTTMLVTKRGDDVYVESWFPSMNTVDKTRVPKNSWPSYHSLESAMVTLKYHLQRGSGVIEERDGQYILTITASAPVGHVYYIDKGTRVILKHLLYENDKLSMTYEWRHTKLNTGLAEDFFRFNLPEHVKKTTRDLTLQK